MNTKDSEHLLDENKLNELAEIYFSAKSDLLCAQVINLRWENTVDNLKKINKGGQLDDPKRPQEQLERETEAALNRLTELVKTETHLQLELEQQLQINSNLEGVNERQLHLHLIKGVQQKIKETQELVWLTQALVELDQEASQRIIDQITQVGDTCDQVVQEVSVQHQELERLLNDCTQVSSSSRTTVDQRDDLLLTLQALVGQSNSSETHFIDRDQVLR